MPQPGNLLDYNRYMYGYGNPVKFSDPSGHCATMADGSPNIETDSGCWAAADEWLKTFGIVGYENGEQWYTYFAANANTTEDVLRNGLHAHWAPIYREMGIHHTRYNSSPTMHEGPPPPPLAGKYKDLYLAPLLACAQAVSGACGVEGSVGVATRGGGAETSLDFYVDSNANIALYHTLGFGPAVSLEPVAVDTGSVSLVVVPNATTNDLSGWGTELEFSVAYGRGLGVDFASNIDPSGQSTFSVAPQTTRGFGSEAHWYITYSRSIYQSQ